MTGHELPIRSTLRINGIIAPMVYWLFIVLVAACLFYPEKAKESYPFAEFFIFLLCSFLFFAVVTGINYLTKEKIIMDEHAITYTNMFDKMKEMYVLSDITGFEWSNRPYVTGQPGGRNFVLKNAYINIFFKGDREITIQGSDFDNFESMQNHIYNYCISNNIIKIKPLEERKRSKMFRSNKN